MLCHIYVDEINNNNISWREWRMKLWTHSTADHLQPVSDLKTVGEARSSTSQLFLPGLQSAFRASNSTETAVMKVVGYLLPALVLLVPQPSTRLNSRNYPAPTRLRTCHGEWNAFTLVRIAHFQWTINTRILCGIPQGSVLGAIIL